MKNPSKTVTMMQLRQHIGEVVNDVLYTSISYVVERRGKPICRIQPYRGESASVVPEDTDHGRRIDHLFGSIKKMRKEELENWTEKYTHVDQKYERKIQKAWK